MIGALLDPAVHSALAGELTPKFLATLDANGRPNCVPIISITPYRDDLLVFGEFMMNKSRANLLTNEKVGVAVFTSGNEAWSIRGTFLGFEKSGAAVDFVNRLPMFRYNAYTSVRAAGLIRIVDVSPRSQLTKTRIVGDFARLMAARPLMMRKGGSVRRMPRQVEEKFLRMSAVRTMAFMDADGYPRSMPLLACVAAGSQRLAFAASECGPYLRDIPRNAEMAACVITMEPIAYQVKGRYTGTRAGVGTLDVTECFSASPPLSGERLDRPDSA